MMEYDIHTVLDAMTLVGTGAVVFCMIFVREIRMSYQKEQDAVKFYFVVSQGTESRVSGYRVSYQKEKDTVEFY